LELPYAEWTREAKAYLKGSLRRQLDAFLPSRETREYESWIKQRQVFRRRVYNHTPSPGLISILTPVWNGSAIKYLRALGQSISEQNESGACEWVILDNGCTNENLRAYLKELSALRWVKIIRSDVNLGITRGLRRCLERANGRYVLPVDGDDLLYADALQVVASALAKWGFPALLYSDEDKVNRWRRYQPYFKPDWDPVLLMNSAYVAHLGVIDRKMALKLNAYSDPETEGSPDWDLFVRFLIAEKAAIHIPEIIYSWRVHPESTADDAARKSYILSSQRKVLQRFLQAQPAGHLFEIEPNPLFKGGDHWHFVRKQEDPKAFMTVVLSKDRAASAQQYLEPARALAQQDGLLCFLGEGAKVESPDWLWEVTGIMDLHPDTIMVGGRIRNSGGQIIEAGLEFGFAGICGGANRGRSADDPGYFGQVWKQRSVDAVSTQFAVMKASVFTELLGRLPSFVSLGFLGVWAGAYAAKNGLRIVYSPFLSAVSDSRWEEFVSEEEKKAFKERYGDLPRGRFYSRLFDSAKPFRPGDPNQSYLKVSGAEFQR
jgi:Glycosyl transferase family 2